MYDYKSVLDYENVVACINGLINTFFQKSD